MIKPLALALVLLTATAVSAAPTHYYRSDATKAMNRPFSDAVEVNGVLYISGQIGAAPGQPKVVDGGLEAQAKQAMDNIGAVLKSRGLTYDDVFKCTVMLGDMSKWGDFNTVYVRYFKPERMPARSAFGASGLALGAALEVECWAKTRK
jgi:reactive intermediate/imine deaminase